MAGDPNIDCGEHGEDRSREQPHEGHVADDLLHIVGGDSLLAEQPVGRQSNSPKPSSSRQDAASFAVDVPAEHHASSDSRLHLMNRQAGSTNRRNRKVQRGIRGGFRPRKEHTIVHIDGVDDGLHRGRGGAIFQSLTWSNRTCSLKHPNMQFLAPPKCMGPPHRKDRQPRVHPSSSGRRRGSKKISSKVAGSNSGTTKKPTQCSRQRKIVEGILHIVVCHPEAIVARTVEPT